MHDHDSQLKKRIHDADTVALPARDEEEQHDSPLLIDCEADAVDQASRGCEPPEGKWSEWFRGIGRGLHSRFEQLAQRFQRNAPANTSPGVDTPGSHDESAVAPDESVPPVPFAQRVNDLAGRARDHATSLRATTGTAARAAGRWFDQHAGAVLLVCTMLLVAIGAVLIFSSSSKVAMESAATHDPAFLFKKHLLFVGVALLGCLGGYCLPHRLLQKRASIIYIGAIVLLVMVLIPGIGTSFNGARRWFRFGFIGFQPSDFAKLALVIGLAHHLSLARVRRNLSSFERGFLPFVGIIAPMLGLILMEPDFGTTLFLTGVAVGLFLLAGGRARHIGLAALPLVLLMAVVVVIKFDHVKPRIEAWVNPDADPSGKGYQVRQSLIALGAGGATGVGLGQSRQALYYLPEESTDFIFAILGEELGFLGVALVLSADILLLLAGLRIAARAPDRFGQLLAAGLTLLIGLQAAINIAVVTASVPNKGIALPFISFGGSLTFFYLVAVGMILGVSRSLPDVAPAPETDPTPTGSDDDDVRAATGKERPARRGFPALFGKRKPSPSFAIASDNREALIEKAHSRVPLPDGRGSDFLQADDEPLNHVAAGADEAVSLRNPDDVPLVIDSRIALSSRRLPLTERIHDDTEGQDGASHRRSA